MTKFDGETFIERFNTVWDTHDVAIPLQKNVTIQREVVIIVIDGNGKQKIRRLFEIGRAETKGSFINEVHLARSKGEIFVAVNTDSQNSPTKSRRSMFNMPASCARVHKVVLRKLDEKNLEPTASRTLENIALSKIQAGRDGILAVGAKYRPCVLDRTIAVAGKINKQLKLEEFWRDRSPFTTRATSIIDGGSGYRIIGNTQQKRLTPTSEGVILKSLETKDFRRLTNEAMASTDSFIMDLDQSGREIKRKTFNTGLPLIVRDAIGTAPTFAVGTLGGFHLWATVD